MGRKISVKVGRLPGGAAPTAAFVTSMVDRTVQVDAAGSTGTGLTYAWNWGDSTASTGGPHAWRTYAAAGSYTVTLTVTNSGGVTATASATVTATDPAAETPDLSDNFDRANSATAIGAAPSGHAPIVWRGTWGVTSNQAYNAGGTSDAAVGWDIGAADAEVRATINATDLGTMLMVRASDDRTAYTLAFNPSVKMYRRVSGSFTQLADYGTHNDGAVYTLRAQGSTITALKNGTTLGSVTDTNITTGNRVGLRADGSGSRFDNLTAGPYPGTAPTARYVVSTSAETATFTNRSTGNPTAYSWDFGDGTTSTAQNPVHTYTAAGTYTAALTVTNGAGTSTTSRQITVVTTTGDNLAGLFSGKMSTRLAANAPLEDRAEYNGTNDTTENRAGVSYATRFATLAQLHAGTTPTYTPNIASGDATITSPGAAPIYVIPTANHPRRLVQWRTNNGTGTDVSSTDPLQSTFQSVPVPTGPGGERFDVYYGRALEGAGSDKQLTIYDPFTGELWEFWLFTWNATNNRYECGYGGYTANALTAPIAFPNQWGARATSLPLHPLNVRRQEWEVGVIRHALSVGIQVIKPGYIPPATREDGTITWHVEVTDGGSKGRLAVPEGAWFRLPASYVVNENRYPDNPAKSKLYAMFVRCARDYGFIVADGTGGTVTLSIEADNAVNTPYSPLTTSTLPVQSAYGDGYYYGNNNWLKDFPWGDLVQIKYTP